VAGLARLARLARDLPLQLGDAAGIPPGLAAGVAVADLFSNALLERPAQKCRKS